MVVKTTNIVLDNYKNLKINGKSSNRKMAQKEKMGCFIV